MTQKNNSGKIQLVKNEKGKWFFRVLSINGQVIVKSSLYWTKAGATKGVHALKKAMENPTTEEFK